MSQHPIAPLIEKADKAINQEDFDTVDLDAEDAVLVIKPGMNAVGKAQIRRAMEAIAAHFEGSLDVRQAEMVILETGDIALVPAKTLVSTLLIDSTEQTMKHLPGFVSANIHRSLDGKKVVNYAQRKSNADFEAMRNNPKAATHMQAAGKLAKFEPIVCEVSDAISNA